MKEFYYFIEKIRKIALVIFTVIFLLGISPKKVGAQCAPGAPCICGGYVTCLGQLGETLQTVNCRGTGNGGCIAVFIYACADTSGNCTQSPGDSCGNAAWPQCNGVCPEGTVCKSGSAYPCHCGQQNVCGDVIGNAPDPIVTRVSPSEADVTWPLNPGQYVTRMSLVVDAIYGNSPPVVDEQNIDPRITGFWHVTGLTAGKWYLVTTTYYAEGATGILSNCSSSSHTDHLSSCRLLPDPLNLAAAGSTGTMTLATFFTARLAKNPNSAWAGGQVQIHP